jgi:hypothetical protein
VIEPPPPFAKRLGRHASRDALASKPEPLEDATADYAVSWNSLAFKEMGFWSTILVFELGRTIIFQTVPQIT